MYRKILAMLLAFAMIIALGVTAYADDEAADMTYGLGDHVDDFTVTLCDGTVFNLDEALEQYDVVMLNIWATWCGPCQQEFPVMDAAYADYMDKVCVVALSPFDSNEDVAAYKEENGLVNINMGSDTVGAGGLVMEGYPTTVIIDRFGNYVYYECGSMLDEGMFTRMWDCFLGDDYTESTVLYEIPGPAYDGLYATDEELSAALSPDGSVEFRSEMEDSHVWPFLPFDIDGEIGVSNSNYDINSSVASVYADVTAEAGQVFAFDYAVDTEAGYDQLYFYVNDELVTGFSGMTEGTYAYRFEEDGDYAIELCYDKDDYAAEDEEITDIVILQNARLLSGDEADEAMAALPMYPCSLDGYDYEIEFLNDNVKEIRVIDETGTFDAYYGGIRMFVIPEENAKVHLSIGDSVDPNLALSYGDDEYVPRVLSQLETDATGFVYETSLSSVEAGSYSNTYIYLFPDTSTFEDYEVIYVFKNEENVNYFIHQELGIDGTTWEYVDGSKPSTDEDAVEPGSTYNVYLVDENGDPVDGAMINICDDETCSPTTVSEGYYGFDGDPYAYVIHVLMVPDGYSFDTTQEFVFDAEGGDLIITIPHA